MLYTFYCRDYNTDSNDLEDVDSVKERLFRPVVSNQCVRHFMEQDAHKASKKCPSYDIGREMNAKVDTAI